jgi:hypothetical protein
MQQLQNHAHVMEQCALRVNSALVINVIIILRVKQILLQDYQQHVCALERNVIKENSVTMENAITRKWKLVIILSFEHTLVFRTRVEPHVLAEGNLLFFQAFNI